MTRTKAMLWGAVYGGGIGPLSAGVFMVAIDMLVTRNVRLSQTRIFLPLLCLIFCGIPGVILGLLSGNRLANSSAWERTLIGIALAFAITILGLFVLDGLPRISTLGGVVEGIWTETTSEPDLLAVIVVPGAICGWIFPTRSTAKP